MKVIILFLFICMTDGMVLPSIPAHLLDCYRGGGPDLNAPKRLDTFLSLLKKLEQDLRLDMRMFSGALLRSFRLDGIEESSNAIETEFLLPFRASNFQFHKYKLLMDLFLPTQNLLQANESLSLTDTCLLHRIMSSTVRQWERGDENLVCPLSIQQRQTMATQSSGRVHSRCPIEDGVIHTDWGPIAPGTLVAAIAASLEPQRVSVTDILNADIFKAGISEPLMAEAIQEWFEDIEAFNAGEQPNVQDISNVWVATLAGDLAEVVVNQGPVVGSVPSKLVVGSNNRWNDTFLPRDYYLLPQNASVTDWHFTDAEILAGIDGLIIANYLPNWIEKRRTLRLSQIIDMYYSHEGISFNSTVRACNRQSLFNEIFRRETLLSEVSKFAQVLSLRQVTLYVPNEEMDRITEAAVSAFMTYAPSLLRRYHVDCHVSTSVPDMDVLVATDGAWARYEVEQFISWVGGALEINLQRNTLALIHGNTGNWIVPPSDNLTEVFQQIHNFNDTWPNRMNLPNVLSRVIQYSRNKSLEEAARNASAGPSTTVLIISPGGRPNANELLRATELMQSLRTSFFDVYFAYVARDLTDFQNLNNQYLDYSELFLSVTSTNVNDVVEAVDTFVVKNEIPTRIFGAHCPFNGTTFEQREYEDFVLPERKVTYRIHPFHMQQQSLIRVQFRNAGQGDLLVCAWRGADSSHSCQPLADRETRVFNLTEPCPTADFCVPAYFTVATTSTANLCAHNECRLPHQVGYYITHTGLRCLPLRSSSETLNNDVYLILFLFLAYFINY
ncbi:hypothetical protein evm_013556 [Chilo suppressalis]|nr:hypothetical protein evm_013556 [Chilo suppressalis]